ncbi:MAG: hypothetical protein UY48_C0043G0001 [Candidatus Gottesmanbacteria bacterium GW2011_GWB1_49_7]|uniref:Uncharacterized protein n=1 Tax=Candidatus Gottesmanbacteria bacterium GW2011_GWB1_49_7 TaxID=1618448 RepID=A0A0G1VUW1_9BACT|nr:MAG: hypothetical protein UY48_C0043G0001 [Candidatus Gottesmanbacteria bacterium GW2011_GWB1_49_7]
MTNNWRNDCLKPGHCPDCGDDLEIAWQREGMWIPYDKRWEGRIASNPDGKHRAVFCACGDRHIKINNEWTKG